jgi:DNA-binding response OmpR family regulator
VEPLAVYPSPPPPDLARSLDLANYAWKPITDEFEAIRAEPDDGWSGAIICADAVDNVDEAWSVCRALRRRDDASTPLLLLIRGNQLDDLEMRDELYDDFCLSPFHPRELEARLRHLFHRDGGLRAGELIQYGPLVLNLETYEAVVDSRQIDLTYMEYELLKFLASHPGRVFTREVLLNRVWGYEYYGGARTVDVHVRRLRSKLGEENANLIQTVRSVGYRFGQSRWASS